MADAAKETRNLPDDPLIEALRALLGEEARIGMLVGVAVGWELARELEPNREGN